MAIQTEQAIRFTDRHKREYHIFPNEILYVEADNIYCLLICKDQNISVPYPIILMQKLLPAYFIRIHRSFLVNQNFIAALYRHTIMLSNGFRLPVPVKKYQWLKKYLAALNSSILIAACEGISTGYPR